VRPADRRDLEKWLQLELPVLTGHLGLARELAASGRRVATDYAVNCFNQHTAAALFGMGVERILVSVELTADEIAAVTAPWSGQGFAALVYGRPEGMTIEHCVLSAAFDREPTTCRDLCVQKHPNVELMDPAGYRFAVATDSACRNRLLHSRPIEGSEFTPDSVHIISCSTHRAIRSRSWWPDTPPRCDRWPTAPLPISPRCEGSSVVPSPAGISPAPCDRFRGLACPTIAASGNVCR
jgi:hypothetical protein